MLPNSTWAQETSADFGASGSVQVGTDSRGCDTSNTEGNIRYNTTDDVIEYCNGTTWVSDGGSSAGFSICSGPTDYTDIGAACTDGSLYGGLLYDNDLGYYVPVYFASSDESTGIQWKSADGTDDVSVDSLTDGRINRDNLNSALSNFPAIEACDDATSHGHSDWYLPSQSELNLAYKIIDAGLGGFNSGSRYWASNETSGTTVTFTGRALTADDYWYVMATDPKTDLHRVRCARR